MGVTLLGVVLMSFVAVTIGFFVGLLCRAMSKDLYTWLKARMAPAPPPINVLESGIVLPDPADPRWHIGTASFVLTSPLRNNNKTQIKTLCFSLGEITLCTESREIYVGTGRALLTTPRTLQYVAAVETAHHGRLALKSIGVEEV